MLKHYLMEYRSTAEAAASPLFSLDESDKLRGIKTMEEKLNSMCYHFPRMQQLHNPMANAFKDMDRKKAQRNERENDVVPESDLSNSCENSETDKMALKKKQQAMEKSVVPTSDIEKHENLPVLRRSKRHLAQSNPSEKRRRVESLKTSGVDIADVLTQTTQTVSSESSQDAPSENTPSGNTHSHGNLKKRQIVHKVVKPAQPVKTPCTEAPHRTRHHVHSTKSVVPESLRLAIAQVVSQRQQLLSRHQSLSESDYTLSDLELPSVDPKPRSNLARKRAYLIAKEFAFEQLKWQRENEFQQFELDLVHREMETRKALAQQELKIKKMKIRADIIQTMLRAGASIDAIAERLKLL